MKRTTLVLPALAGLLAPTLAACGTTPAGAPSGEAITVGTTDRLAVTDATPAPLDPAAGYDIGVWNVMRNTFQTLLRTPNSGTEPEPEAARECGFTDARNTTFSCTLRDGLTFSNGHALTSEDVKFSVERMLEIGAETGPATLLNGLRSVEAPSSSKVVFRLEKPDATFPHKLATPAAAILDSEVYPRDTFLDGDTLVGSGPYTVESLDEDGTLRLAVNPDYSGALKAKNEGVEIRSFDDSEAMEEALTSGDIDVMNRSISAKQAERLKRRADQRIELYESPGQEIRYLVLDTADGPTAEVAVRRAMAQVVDRAALAGTVYRGAAQPLYSLVPAGLPGHRNSFFNEYGEPDAAAAAQTLRKAGIDTPVKMTLHYTTDHYGAVTKEEFEALSDQLDATGLFDTDVQGTPWEKYRPATLEHEYAVYGFGWFPDFPDADNFIAPFFEEKNFLDSAYVNDEIRDRIIPQTRREADRAQTADDFGRAQDIIAEEVPVLPLWQGKQYLAASDDIIGLEWALNSSSTLQLWELEQGVEN